MHDLRSTEHVEPELADRCVLGSRVYQVEVVVAIHTRNDLREYGNHDVINLTSENVPERASILKFPGVHGFIKDPLPVQFPNLVSLFQNIEDMLNKDPVKRVLIYS